MVSNSLVHSLVKRRALQLLSHTQALRPCLAIRTSLPRSPSNSSLAVTSQLGRRKLRMTLRRVTSENENIYESLNALEKKKKRFIFLTYYCPTIVYFRFRYYSEDITVYQVIWIFIFQDWIWSKFLQAWPHIAWHRHSALWNHRLSSTVPTNCLRAWAQTRFVGGSGGSTAGTVHLHVI